MADTKTDVLIAGGGIVGYCLALALKRAEGARLAPIVLAPERHPGHLAAGDMDPRSYAISAGSVRLLDLIGIWDKVRGDVQAISDMALTDSRLEDVFRPVRLTFEGEARPGEPFAHIVPAALLDQAVAEQVHAEGIQEIADRVIRFDDDGTHITILGALGNYAARLLVAADGANSPIRALAGIATVDWAYGQTGIAATITHQSPHENRATQHFLPGGPLALLPLPDDSEGRHRSSIVWTVPTARAEELLSLDALDFAIELEQSAGPSLGEMTVLAGPGGFPLDLKLARAFVAPRIALVGDAAHRVHPIAGQGLNLGLKDVAALAETVVDAVRLGIDPGSLTTLHGYERWRRADTVQLAMATDAINRLFRIDNPILRGVRDLGLSLVDRAGGLKRIVVREASGDLGRLPRLIDGAPL
ncbi:MAG: FAD-dependent monooxygenase [Pseudomonadota bacterium]